MPLSLKDDLLSIPPPWGRLGEGRHIVMLIPMQMAFPLPASPKGEGMWDASLFGSRGIVESVKGGERR